MSPFRWDVLLVGLVLAVPVLALGMRGDLDQEMVARLPWCLAAGWAVVALLRFASAPRTPERTPRPAGAARGSPGCGRHGRRAGADRLTHRARRPRPLPGCCPRSGSSAEPTRR